MAVKKVMKFTKKPTKVKESLNKPLSTGNTKFTPKEPLHKVTCGRVRMLDLPPGWTEDYALKVKHVQLDVSDKKFIYLPITNIDILYRNAFEIYSVDDNNKPVKGCFGANPFNYMEWTRKLEAALKILILSTYFS